MSVTYELSGSVSGLVAGGLVLTAGAAEQVVGANGTLFKFGSVLVAGATYEVKVKTQPTGQNCTVANGTGTTGTADVGNVAISCVTPPPPTYSISGTVSGLASGASLVAQTNGANNVTVSANGNMTFASGIASGNNYSVTVLTQPTNPAQKCHRQTRRLL